MTPLATRIGYDQAAALAHRAYQEGKTVRQAAMEPGLLDLDGIEAILAPRSMLGSGHGG